MALRPVALSLPPSMKPRFPLSLPPKGESQDKDAPALRMALRPQTPFVVRDRDAFIQFIPENTIRLTVGIDHSASAEVRGKWRGEGRGEDGTGQGRKEKQTERGCRGQRKGRGQR